jgi:hypothetical protein
MADLTPVPSATDAGLVDIFDKVALNRNDDLRLTQSSPAEKPSTIVDTGEEIFFDTKSSDAELLSLLAVTRQAALQVLRGEREGPLSLGWTTEDTFHRMRARLSSAYRLSWGLSHSLEDAAQVVQDRGRFGLVLFWGNPSPVHEDTILWLTFKVKEQLYD